MSRIDHIHNEYYDYDRYMGGFPDVEVIREEKRTARFSHKCHCCGMTIPPGEKYNYFFVRDLSSDTVYSSHQHEICPVPDDLVCPITGELR